MKGEQAEVRQKCQEQLGNRNGSKVAVPDVDVDPTGQKSAQQPKTRMATLHERSPHRGPKEEAKEVKVVWQQV